MTCTTQEVLLFRDPKTKEVIVGQEDRVEQCTYGAILTRIPEEMDNELTGGWKVVEVRLSSFPLVSLLTDSLLSRWRGGLLKHTYRWFLSCLGRTVSFVNTIPAQSCRTGPLSRHVMIQETVFWNLSYSRGKSSSSPIRRRINRMNQGQEKKIGAESSKNGGPDSGPVHQPTYRGGTARSTAV